MCYRRPVNPQNLFTIDHLRRYIFEAGMGCDLRAHGAATAAVSNKTRPSPTRLAAGPIESATHPKPVIPAIADAIDPTLNVVNTRPMRCSGVTSCKRAHTIGLSTAVLPPTIMTTPAAISGVSSRLRLQTARPPIVIPLTTMRNRPRMSLCFFHASQVEAASIPTPSADHNQPNCTGPTWTSFVRF